MAYKFTGELEDWDEPEPQAIPDPEDPSVAPAPAVVAPAPAAVAPAPVIPEVTNIPEVTFEEDQPKPPTRFEGELEDYVPPEPVKPKADTGWLSNVARGIGERGVELVGGTAGTLARIAEGAGDWMDENIGRVGAGGDNMFGWRQLTPEETAGRSSWITEKLLEVEKGMSDPDFGYDPRTTWDDVKNAPVSNVIPFAIEAGLVSLPDMIAAIRNAPGYALEQAGEIGGRRAEHEGRTEPTFGDIVKALPAAAVSAWMEKLGTSALLGRFAGGEAILSEMKQLPAELLKTLMTEGATEAAQQAAQIAGAEAFTEKGVEWWKAAEEVVQAGIVGAIFGPAVRTATGTVEVATAPIENEDDETEDKVDDAAEISAETQPEGTPATAAEGAAAGTSTPGSLGATTPAQPAGVDQQPVIDPKVTVTQPEPGAQPAPKKGDVDPAIAAALGGMPNAPSVAPTEILPDEEGLGEEEDIDLGVADTDLSAHEARIRDMFRRENDQAREKAAQATKVEKAGTDIAAALAAGAVSPGPPAPVVAPQIPAAAPAPAPTPAPAPVTTESLGTGRALNPAPAEQVAATPPVLPEQAPAAVAAELQPVNPTVTPMPVEGQEVAAQLEPPAAAVSLEAAPAEAPAEPLRAPVRYEGELEDVTPEEVAAFNTQPAAAPVKRAPGKLTLKSTEAPAPGAKGQALKVKNRGKTVYVPDKAAPVLETTREEASEAEAAPAPAAPTPKAVRTNLSRDVAAAARDSDTLRKSTVSELGHEFREALEDVAAEHVQAVPRGERSPAQYFRDEAEAIAGKVKERLAERTEAEDKARVEAAEYLTTYGKKKADKKVSQDAMAHAEEGQKKERAGKNKGKSAVGIRAEKPDSTERAYERELKKKPEARSPELLKWGQLRAQQKKLAPSDVKGRGAIQTQLDELQEARAVAAEQQEAEDEARGAKLSERALEAERQAAEAIEAVPRPARNAQIEEINAYFDAFIKATKGLKLHPHHDSKHQSAAENLVIYARKVEKNQLRNDTENKAQYEGIGPSDFMAASELYNIGAVDAMNDMVVSEQLAGSGYSEALGENLDQAWVEDEDRGEIREHETEEGYEALADIDFLRRGRKATRAAHEKAAGVEADDAVEGKVPVYLNGPKPVIVDAESDRGSTVLRDIARWMNEEGGPNQKGFWAVLRNAHIRHLIKMVGDVEVHAISDKDMRRLTGNKSGVSGIYLNYSNESRAHGFKPAVFINKDMVRGRADYSHTVIHEMTHAATSQALRDNVRGTAKILDAMRKSMRKQLLTQYSEAELRAKDLWYAFDNEAEFLAEAFSNPDFQQLMARLIVPAKIRSQIQALGKGRAPTWWDAFTAAVSNAIGMVSGQRGQTYMEQVIALSPHVTRSSVTQQILADRETFGAPPKPLPRPTFDSIFDGEMQAREITGVFEAVKGRVSDRFGGKRRWRDIFASNGELVRRAENLFGGANNAFERLSNIHTKGDQIKQKYRDSATGKGTDNRKIEMQTLELSKKEPSQYAAFGQWMDDATTAQVNGTVPLSHPDNAHISKAGQRGQDAREWHKDLADRYAKMSPAAQKLTRDSIAHYKKTRDIEVAAQIKNAIHLALSGYRKKLPAGTTLDDVVKWVRSGGAARQPADYQPGDKELHEAIGNTAKTLASIKELRSIKGVYMPKIRKGQFLITATERPFGTIQNPKNVPNGATLDALTKQEEDTPNRLLFTNRADYDAFVAAYPGQVTASTRHVDPATGKKVPYDWSVADPSVPGGLRTPRKLFVATVQTKRMEMSDSKSALRKRRAQLKAEGHKVSTVRISKNDLAKATEEITSPQIKALLRNLEQTTIGNKTVGQQAVAGAILDAHVRSLNTPAKLKRELKRKNILGNEIDPLQSLTNYNRSLASGLANYELGPQLAEADHALTELMNELEHRDYDDGKTFARQHMASELRHRIKDTQRVAGPRALEAVKKVVYMIHLASPHYSAIQTTQIPMITMPILSGKYGAGAAQAEMRRAMRLGGVRKSLGRGFREFWAEGRRTFNLGGDTETTGDYWRRLIKGQPDEAFLLKVLDHVDEQGLGAQGGFEAQQIEEVGMNAAEIALNRMTNLARAFPQELEGMNRYLTAIVTARLELRRAGSNEDLAIREAALTVEQSQGGYGAANNPVFMSNPWLAPATQFRKFGLMMGQLYYGRINDALRGKDAETRRMARKQLAWISLAIVAVAGVEGLPPVEIARMLINLAVLLGFKEDDWETDAAQMQEYIAKLTGSEKLSEAMFHGLPRLLALDLSNSLGASSLLMFGQPDRIDPDGVTDWLAQAYGGAVGAAATKSMKAFQEADSFTDYLGAIPLPKIVQNLKDSWTLATKGTVNKRTGEQYMDKVGLLEAGYKAFGFRTASEARQWEAGGSGYENKRERRERDSRRKLMDKWQGSSPGERRRIFNDEIREWNRQHRREADMKIDMGDLQRRREQTRKRERERGL